GCPSLLSEGCLVIYRFARARTKSSAQQVDSLHAPGSTVRERYRLRSTSFRASLRMCSQRIRAARVNASGFRPSCNQAMTSAYAGREGGGGGRGRTRRVAQGEQLSMAGPRATKMRDRERPPWDGSSPHRADRIAAPSGYLAKPVPDALIPPRRTEPLKGHGL